MQLEQSIILWNGWGFMEKLKIKKISIDAILPTRGYDTDGGMDLYTNKNIKCYPRQTTKIPTGIAMEIPETYVGSIRDRSSLGAKGIHVLGGVIDENFRGQIFICLHNLTNLVYEIKKGDRIAQILIHKVHKFELIEVDELDETERSTGGFGSTGR